MVRYPFKFEQERNSGIDDFEFDTGMLLQDDTYVWTGPAPKHGLHD